MAENTKILAFEVSSSPVSLDDGIEAIQKSIDLFFGNKFDEARDVLSEQ